MNTIVSDAPEKTTTAGQLPRLSGPAVISAVYWLICDTFRQALAGRIFWIMLAVSAVCVIFCLGISVESGLGERLPDDTALFTVDHKPFTGGKTNAGSLTLLYGFVHIDHNRHPEQAVRFIQVVLAGFVAGVLGLILSLMWTAGFVPEFLQPSAAAVLLTKPIPRSVLLAGKYLGVLAFVGFEVLVFFVGTWLALAIRTGVWDAAYLAAIPLFVLEFATIFSFTVLLAVLTRSTIACTFGSILFWLLCWSMNVGRHLAVGFDQLAGESARLGPLSRALIEAGYWVLPKPADIAIIREEALGAGTQVAILAQRPELQAIFATNQFLPELSILCSLAFAVGMLIISARHLSQTDY